ncbi:MAG TPA: hypothetical protein ENJ64_04125, partial [Thiotrichales bacterium]|nr:hypothetical protein [Thiotrichales bacterium]
MFMLFFLVLAVVWAAYEYGRYSAGYDSSDAQAYIIRLENELDEARLQTLETQRQASMLERSRQIDDDAAEQLKQTLVESQNEVMTLKKELAFYKSIVAPEQGDRSLAIQSMQIKPAADGRYHYKIMVSQRGRNDRFARGTIDVSIEGVTNGEPTTLKLSDVSNETKKIMKFGFKYFQNFEGVLTLPPAFQPDTIHVKVKPKKGKLKPIDEQFAW